MNLMRQIELEHMKAALPDFGVGDSVDVHYLIKEGDKERIQVFSGTVLAIKGSGVRRTALVRRLVGGEGVERVFPLHSPRVHDITVRERGRVRRSRLFYLRNRIGKAVRLGTTLGRYRAPRSGKGSGLARPAANAGGKAGEAAQ